MTDIPEYQELILPLLRQEFLSSQKTVVVLDDDPTGTQTCHDVVVLTRWEVDLLVEELAKKPSILFILTNSRSLSASAAVELAHEVGTNLVSAVRISGREIVPISRSDSTLRGHYPDEVDAIAEALGIADAVRIIIPAFIEGGRFTIDDVHYLVEQGKLTPVAETPFARDASFGYKNSNLKKWVEEKTKGAVKHTDVHSISLETIRKEGPSGVMAVLNKCKPNEVCIVNASSFSDLEVVAMGVVLAEKKGQKFLSRTSATYVSIRAGIAPGHIYVPDKTVLHSRFGSLVVVGSYVPKTTSQLEDLLADGSHQSIEVDVSGVLDSADRTSQVTSLAAKTDQWLRDGEDVVIYTSRRLIAGEDSESSLEINHTVSIFLVSLLQSITVRPAFMVAKGGITSSDLASKGLGVSKALILGQAIPGVPVWQLDDRCRFPGLIYVVFPGNVGDARALTSVSSKMIEARKG